jgi:xanthosine utilization system XapX-like protein
MSFVFSSMSLTAPTPPVPFLVLMGILGLQVATSGIGEGDVADGTFEESSISVMAASAKT